MKSNVDECNGAFVAASVLEGAREMRIGISALNNLLGFIHLDRCILIFDLVKVYFEPVGNSVNGETGAAMKMSETGFQSEKTAEAFLRTITVPYSGSVLCTTGAMAMAVITPD